MDRGSRSLHRMHKWQPEAPAHVRYCMVAASRRLGESAKYGETVHTSTDHKEIEGECGCARNGGHG